MGTRLIGQDTSVVIIKDKVPLVTIDSIKSCEVTFMTEILKEQFLGETTDRHDEVFRGMAGKIEAQLSGKDLFTLAVQIAQRARNRQKTVRINIKSTFQFSDGDRAIFIIPDCKFGNIPINNKGRTDYVDIALDYNADDFQFITR